MMQRIILVSLAVCASAALFAGCGSASTTTAPAPEATAAATVAPAATAGCSVAEREAYAHTMGNLTDRLDTVLGRAQYVRSFSDYAPLRDSAADIEADLEAVTPPDCLRAIHGKALDAMANSVASLSAAAAGDSDSAISYSNKATALYGEVTDDLNALMGR